jgi:copper(I)-binding protein
MNKSLLASLLLAPVLSFACTADDLVIKNAYVLALPSDQHNTAAYMDIENKCAESMKLTGASSPVADKAQLHETQMKKNVAKMHKVGSVALPPQSTTSFASGGMHIMIFGLGNALEAGQTLPLTLQFENGITKSVELPVKDLRN